MNRIYHVAKWGCDRNDGSEKAPFLTIGKAAEAAEKGDTVIVHEGIYREWVKPAHKGYSELTRIIYKAADGEKAVIKGSEVIDTWEHVQGDVWKVTLPDSFFGDYNPYREVLGGDWFMWPVKWQLHPGEVYLNGRSFYEARCLEDVFAPEKRINGVPAPWVKHEVKLADPEGSLYQWYVLAGEDSITIYANFHGYDPNRELTEINVRKCCFYPEQTGIDYITVSGFEMAQAATPFVPPTADQPGMLGTHWSKGWIIENNILHDSKCAAISIGKEASTGDNLCTRRQEKPGYQYQMEAVFKGLQIGWSKEKIGSHIIRNNEIYNCNQNGIVGHMGGAFCEIYDNHIYNIATKFEFFGHEIAGIKLHAAVDTKICHNRIHDCTLGAWFDWQAQGTRISRNLFYGNDRDLMIEVTHGPCLVDNNIFASAYNFDNVAQGTAFVHNLCGGYMRRIKVLDRATPYHFPHTTQVKGVALVYLGDDRIYNNIFIGHENIMEEDSFAGTEGYDMHPSSMEAFVQTAISMGNEDHSKFAEIEQPVYIDGNLYLKGAKGYVNEQHCAGSEADPELKVTEDADGIYLEISLPENAGVPGTVIRGTDNLGITRITEGIYDDPDGRKIVLDTDYNGEKRVEHPLPGPLESLTSGVNRVIVWKK